MSSAINRPSSSKEEVERLHRAHVTELAILKRKLKGNGGSLRKRMRQQDQVRVLEGHLLPREAQLMVNLNNIVLRQEGD